VPDEVAVEQAYLLVFQFYLYNSNSSNAKYSSNYQSGTMGPVEVTVPNYTQFHQNNKTDWKLMSTDYDEMTPARSVTD
jgi:hypothetical protein